MSIIKGTNQIVAGFGGTKENIGDVKWSYSKLATDNSGRLPLFTGETITSANTIYPEFYNWILAHTELQCTSAEYEAALTKYGECAKYVLGTEGIVGFCLRTDYSGDAPDDYYVSSSSLNGRIINSSWGTDTVNRNPIVYFNLSKVKNKPYTSFQIYLDNNLTQKALINKVGQNSTGSYLGVRYNLDENKFYFTIATTAANTDSDEFTGTSLLSSDCCIEADKYVYHSSSIPVGSLRLPLIKNYIKAANTAEGIKNIEAGLPNIDSDTNWVNATGGTKTTATNTNVLSDKGAFGGTNSQGGHGIKGNDFPINWRRFDASLSNPIYGKSSTVTPASTTLYPWVVAYTAAIPASTAQAAEFQQGLSGKADTNLSNTIPSQSFKEMSVGWGMPDYSAGVSVANSTIVSGFTAPCDGVFMFDAGIYKAKINGIAIVTGYYYTANKDAYGQPVSMFLSKGDILKANNVYNTTDHSVFYPLKGVN